MTGCFFSPQTKEEMAKTIAFRREGIIAMQGRSVLILDVDGLRAIVEG